MARPLRIEFDGAVYHVTSRGNERRPVFRDDSDRKAFLNILTQVNRRFHWLCHAYCLMGNHYHLVIETPEGNLSKGMRALNGIYTQGFNKRHRRVGHLFQGRYKAILVDKDSYLLEVCRYVVLNPVRAKMVRKPEDWLWSSYRATAGRIQAPSNLTVDWLLGQFGRSLKDARREYREFVRAGIGETALWDSVRGQSLLGGDDFVDRLKDYLAGRKLPREIPRSQRYLGRPTLERLFSEGVRRVKEKRDRKMVEATERYGYSQKEVAKHLGLHYSTVCRIVNGR